MFGIALFGLFHLACLALAPLTIGLARSPAFRYSSWRSGSDVTIPPRRRTPHGPASSCSRSPWFALLWVFLALWRDTDLFGRAL